MMVFGIGSGGGFKPLDKTNVDGAGALIRVASAQANRYLSAAAGASAANQFPAPFRPLREPFCDEFLRTQ
jgi:hypothetical protein